MAFITYFQFQFPLLVSFYGRAAVFFILQNFRRKFVNLVAPLTDGSTKRLVRYKVHQVL